MLLKRSRLPAILVAYLLLAGCSAWVPQHSDADALMRERNPQLVRVTLASGRILEVASPRVEHDSLFGLIPHSAPAGQTLKSFQAPLDSVRNIAVKQSSITRMASAAVIIPALVGGSLYLMGF